MGLIGPGIFDIRTFGAMGLETSGATRRPLLFPDFQNRSIQSFPAASAKGINELKQP